MSSTDESHCCSNNVLQLSDVSDSWRLGRGSFELSGDNAYMSGWIPSYRDVLACMIQENVENYSIQSQFGFTISRSIFPNSNLSRYVVTPQYYFSSLTREHQRANSWTSSLEEGATIENWMNWDQEAEKQDDTWLPSIQRQFRSLCPWAATTAIPAASKSIRGTNWCETKERRTGRSTILEHSIIWNYRSKSNWN